MGEMVTAGFAGGIDASAPAANDSMSAMVQPPAASALGGGVSNRVNVVVNVNVTSGGEAGPLAELEEAVRRGVQSALEQLALQAA